MTVESIDNQSHCPISSPVITSATSPLPSKVVYVFTGSWGLGCGQLEGGGVFYLPQFSIVATTNYHTGGGSNQYK